jgi:hypothetical protein
MLVTVLRSPGKSKVKRTDGTLFEKGPISRGSVSVDFWQNRFQNLGLKAAPLLGWSDALETSGFLGRSVVQYPVGWMPSHGARAASPGRT